MISLDVRDFFKRHIIGMVLTIAIIIVILILVASVNGGSLDITDREMRIIVTDSMDGEPTGYDISTIPKGSLVVVRHISDDEKKDLQVGDVIQFRFNGMLDHHRIQYNDPEKQMIGTKGDNSPDGEVVNYPEVLGKVVGCSPPLGKLFTFVQDYRFMLLFAAIFIITAGELIKEIRKGRDPA